MPTLKFLLLGRKHINYLPWMHANVTYSYKALCSWLSPDSTLSPHLLTSNQPWVMTNLQPSLTDIVTINQAWLTLSPHSLTANQPWLDPEPSLPDGCQVLLTLFIWSQVKVFSQFQALQVQLTRPDVFGTVWWMFEAFLFIFIFNF